MPPTFYNEVNEHIYKEECLGNMLFPFTKKYYSGKYVFWADLASSRYSKIV